VSRTRKRFSDHADNTRKTAKMFQKPNDV